MADPLDAIAGNAPMTTNPTPEQIAELKAAGYEIEARTVQGDMWFFAKHKIVIHATDKEHEAWSAAWAHYQQRGK
jgi:hypothetical protein